MISKNPDKVRLKAGQESGDIIVMKVLITALISVALFLTVGDVSGSSRRLLTYNEQEAFSSVFNAWIAQNWQDKREYAGGYITEKLTDTTFCCIDSYDGGELYIVDVSFHAQWFERGTVVDEADLVQRLLMHVVNNVIQDWDPMPAYRTEEEFVSQH